MFKNLHSLLVNVLSPVLILFCLSSVGQTTGCGDGLCISSSGESVLNCARDCAPNCGDGICGQSPSPGYPTETSMNCAKDCAPICGDKVCAKVPLSHYSPETYANCPQDCIAVCGNGVCDSPDEDAIECPSDCSSISFNGVLLEAWPCSPKTMCSSWYKKATLNISNLEDVANGSPIGQGKITGYFRSKGCGDYELQLTARSIPSKVYINGVLVIDAYYFADREVQIVKKVTLPETYIHSISIELNASSSSNKSISLLWRLIGDSMAPFKDIESVFFSKNVCGDNILDTNESCPADSANNKITQYASGKGICLEKDPNRQFTDCFRHITDTCSQVSVFPESSSIKHDSLGNLMQNQMLWRLPGSEIMTFGVDIITGEPRLSPLFYFSYCNASTLQVVQDTYRGNTYIIPPELHAQSSPKCSFSMDSHLYSSSIEMANELSQEAGISISVNGGGSLWDVGLKASAAFSKEKSVEQARSLESKQSGSLISTQVSCETFKVKITKITFHPSFLGDLAQARTSDDYLKLIKRYGTHYYKRATLGGKLKQITAMSKTLSKSKTEQEQSQSAQRSFGASISSPVFSVSGDYSDSSDSSVKGSDQQDFENQSSRSTVITYGGPPGSFGPSTSDAPSNFGDWASNIDLLPVPIDYELESIASIIPDDWMLPNGTKIVDLWKNAEQDYKTQNEVFRLSQFGLTRYFMLWQLFRWTLGTATTSTQVTVAFGSNNRTLMYDNGPSGTYTTLQFNPSDFGKDYPTPYKFSLYFPEKITQSSVLTFAASNPDWVTPLFSLSYAFVIDTETGQVFSYPLGDVVPDINSNKVSLSDSSSFPAVNTSQLYLELSCSESCNLNVNNPAYYFHVLLKGRQKQSLDFWIPLNTSTIPSANSPGILFAELGVVPFNVTSIIIGFRYRTLPTTASDLSIGNVFLIQSFAVPNSTRPYRLARGTGIGKSIRLTNSPTLTASISF